VSVEGFIILQAGWQCLGPRILLHDWPAQKFLLNTLDTPLALVDLGGFDAHVIRRSETKWHGQDYWNHLHGGMEKLDGNWG
jgi:hypothetical protein